MNGIMAAILATDCPRGAWVIWSGIKRVIRTFAICYADWMNWWQVENIESHLGNGRESKCGGFKCATLPGSVFLLLSTFGAWKKFIPVPVKRSLAFYIDWKWTISRN